MHASAVTEAVASLPQKPGRGHRRSLSVRVAAAVVDGVMEGDLASSSMSAVPLYRVSMSTGELHLVGGGAVGRVVDIWAHTAGCMQ